MKTDDVNRLIEQAQCKTHPDAPHGFDRNASHSADRYVCECESWEPVDAVNMSQDRVDETVKSEHEWVGLTEDEMQETGRYSYCRGGTSEKLYNIMWNSQPSASVGWCRAELIAFARAIEAKLKEKNCG